MHHPSIRTLAGAKAAAALQASSTALLVIDFQNEYFSGKLPVPDAAETLAQARRLIAHADAHRMPVFHVQHVSPAGGVVFAADSPTVEFHADAQPAPHHKVVKKNTASVFVSSDIDQQLKDAGIKTLLICGLMTHNCIAGAARDAVPKGYAVIVAADASGTRAIDNPLGGTTSHVELHQATLTGLSDTFGSVLTTDAILALAVN